MKRVTKMTIKKFKNIGLILTIVSVLTITSVSSVLNLEAQTDSAGNDDTEETHDVRTLDDGMEIITNLEGSSFEIVETHQDKEELTISPYFLMSFAAPADGPHVGYFNSGGPSTVNVHSTSTGGYAPTYLTNNSSSGVFPILDEADGRYKIAISGTIGWVNKSLVTLSTYSAAKSTDYYKINSAGELIHYISLGAHQTSVSAITQGVAPSYLKNTQTYLSYDGHYFYNDNSNGLQTLINDYNAGHRNNAVNKEAFYNYFQWLPARTQTTLNEADLRNYLLAQNLNTPLKSRMFETEQIFLDYGNFYGGNGALAFATGIHESGYGRSSFSRSRNNYFGHAAYDSSPGSASAYASPGSGIEIHYGRFYNWNYINPDPTANGRGASVGDKGSGMNVKYASDAYWGEKIAAHYFNIDKLAGGKDYKRYTIGLIDEAGVNIRKGPNTSFGIVYKTKIAKMPIAILETKTVSDLSGSTNWYGFSSDAMLDANKNAYEPINGVSIFDRYNYDTSNVYVHENLVTIVSQGKNSVRLPQSNTALPKTPKIDKTSTTVFTIDNANLRPDWSTKYQTILTVGRDVELTGYLTDNGWVRVVHDGEIGYLNTDLVSRTKGGTPISNNGNTEEVVPEELPKPGSKAMVTTDRLNLRSKPVSGSVILTIPKGSEVTVGSAVNGWVHAKYGANSGYVSIEYLKEDVVTPPEPPLPPVETYELGDVNADGRISALDYIIIKNYIMEKRTLTDAEKVRADISGDGRISALDYMKIKNLIMSN